MKIAMRAGGEGKKRWKKVEGGNYRDEAHLQHLLYDSPDLIPIDELGDGVIGPRLFIKEAGLQGSGSSDLVGVDEGGGITIVECKLATNPDVRRKVIGQVLEYAAYLWQMSYDEFDDIVRSQEGQPLADLMRQRLTEGDLVGDWSEEEFRAGVAETLHQGAFRLIIAVDEVNDELRRVLQYLNASGPTGFSIYGMEMHYFTDDQTELLVPQLVGIVARKPGTATAERRKWNAQSFFKEAEAKNPSEVVQMMRDLLAFSEEEADRVWWGTGKWTATFTFYLSRGKAPISVFTVTHEGGMWLNVGQMREKVSDSLLKQFLPACEQSLDSAASVISPGTHSLFFPRCSVTQKTQSSSSNRCWR